MRAQQIGQPAHLAPAHGIGLARQRQRPGAGPADLARRQMQIDQRRIIGRAAAALVQALAVQAERGTTRVRRLLGTAQRHPARRPVQVRHGQAADGSDLLGRGFAHQFLERRQSRWCAAR
jgi:hypothetical protein